MTSTVGGLRAGLLRFGAAAGIAVGALVASGSPAAAAVVYDEGVSGDLSNSGLTPTAVSFGIGGNTVTGTTGHDQAGAIDRDYWTFTIGVDQALVAINVLEGTQTVGFSFIGLESGNQVTLDPGTMTAAGLLGWTHYDSTDVGTNILDDIGVAGNGSSGFTGSLGPGTYSVWLQEISPTAGAIPFGFDFIVAQVPEPSTWAMMMVGFGMVGFAVRRRRKMSELATARA